MAQETEKNIDQVRALLSNCKREECQDHAFGDAEVYWTQGDIEVASGYFGADVDEVTSSNPEDKWSFHGADAFSLRYVGKSGRIDRNDSTGPAEYREGECMPGLTLNGVLDEVT